MTAEDPPRTDKHGHGLERYPDTTEHGRLLGFNAAGNAAYATDERVTLATLDERGSLRTPPRERYLAGEFPLSEVGLSPGDYVLYAADEVGPWRALTDLGREGVESRGVAPERVLTDAPAAGAPEELAATLADTGLAAAEAAGDLRRIALDRPGAVAEHTGVLARLVDRAVEAGTFDTDDGEDEGFDRLATLRDVTFTLARVARSHPGAVRPHLEVVLSGLAAAPDDDPLHVESLLDVFDVLGRDDPAGVAALLCDRLDGSPSVAVETLEALYRLEHRYARDEHPLLGDERLREAVEALSEHGDPAVREAAESVQVIHGFHR